MGLKPVLKRTTAAYLNHQNGAWLISVFSSTTTNGVEGDYYTAASSLLRAKKVAVESAREVGFEGRPKWIIHQPDWLELEMTERGEEWDGEIDDE